MNNFSTMPLRFRVWDKKEKRLRKIEEIDFERKEIVPTDGIDVIPFDDAIISQDTGLKDRNGKSIFIGDIIRWPKGSKRETYIYKAIAYIDGQVMYDDGPAGGAYRYEEVTLLSEDEVVGNIWQNPELLEE